MNRRTLILVLLVVVLGGGAAALLLSQQPPAPADPGQGGPSLPQDSTAAPVEVQFVEVIVAVQELPRGFPITEDAIDSRLWPIQSAPQNGILSRDDAIGKIARTDIAREAPILYNQLVDNLRDIGQAGSDAAAVMPPGRVGIAVPIDRLTNVANAPQSGDYVDVILSFLIVDVDEEFQSRLPNSITLTTLRQDGTLEFQSGIEGRVEPSGDFPYPVIVGPSETMRPRLVTQLTVQQALVINVGDFPEDGDFLGRRPTPTPIATPEGQEANAAPPPTIPPKDIITLAVEPQDAVVLVWAIESRLPITLTLRAVGDLNRNATNAVTLEYMISTYNVPQPPRLPYALEPAIRSIRQLILGNVVEFAEDRRPTE
jgi:pilus assembly protein CpaB